RLLARRADLKVIVTSATIDTARFAAHFGNAPVIEVEGRTYPVEVRWRPMEAYAAAGRGRIPPSTRPGEVPHHHLHRTPEPDSQSSRQMAAGRKGADGGRALREDLSQTEHIFAAVDEITREDPLGDALVFLPGEREIRDAH